MQAVAEEWPIGATVWHRGCGSRGVVCEYCVDGGGSVKIMIAWQAGEAWDRCMPMELSASPVPENGDGNEWKGEAGV